MSQSQSYKFFIIPFADLEKELEGWLHNIDDELNIPDSTIFDLLLNYYHDHRQVLLTPKEIYEQQAASLNTYVRAWITQNYGKWSLTTNIFEEETDSETVFEKTVSHFEHAMGIIYQRFYTVLRYFYHHHPYDPPLEFCKWVGGDVMLVRSKPVQPQTYRLTGAFTGGDYGDYD